MFTLENLSSLISIITPSILLIWFYYSQKQYLSKLYFKEIDGLYAGYTKPILNKKNRAGLIMNIRETDDKGFFKGEFQYKEIITKSDKNGEIIKQPKKESIYNFYGRMNHKIYLNKKRNPFILNKNRKYNGTFYIVNRLDFDFDKNKIEDYLKFKYSITHFREMQTLDFHLIESYSKNKVSFPKSFRLYKKVGFDFEPFNNVKKEIFNNDLIIDK